MIVHLSFIIYSIIYYLLFKIMIIMMTSWSSKPKKLKQYIHIYVYMEMHREIKMIQWEAQAT